MKIHECLKVQHQWVLVTISILNSTNWMIFLCMLAYCIINIFTLIKITDGANSSSFLSQWSLKIQHLCLSGVCFTVKQSENAYLSKLFHRRYFFGFPVMCCQMTCEAPDWLRLAKLNCFLCKFSKLIVEYLRHKKILLNIHMYPHFCGGLNIYGCGCFV